MHTYIPDFDKSFILSTVTRLVRFKLQLELDSYKKYFSKARKVPFKWPIFAKKSIQGLLQMWKPEQNGWVFLICTTSNSKLCT